MLAAARASKLLVPRPTLVRRHCPPTNRLIWKRLSSSSSSAVATISDNSNTLPSKLIDFSIAAKIEGEESQIAKVKLRPGDVLRAEAGAMLYMTDGVEMNTSLQGASAAFTRMMTGQNVFLTDFTYTGTKEGTVGLGTDFPSKIVRLTLEDYENSTLICQRGAYMASNPSVDISMEATKSLSAGFFGGQGFILQRLSGKGDVLVKAGGTLVVKDLQEGERLRVTSGSIVAFTSTVDYDIQMMPGVKNVMFGGEGLFVTTLTGPGRVWLQGMPADRMIAEIASRVPSGMGFGIPIGFGGGGGGGAAGEAGGTDGVTGGAADEATSGGEEMVAATDAAVHADRQATVASSGMMGEGSNSVDSESSSALFGDAAHEQGTAHVPSTDTATSFPSDGNLGGGTDTTYSDDGSPSVDETEFSSSEDSFSTDDDFGQANGDFSDDSTTTDVFESISSETPPADSGSSIFSTLWDLFTGGDE